ncbi:MAG: hypothetical protein HQL87_14425 [Magnetococcales bacterium]|nr:hypothetical protein [Magnetococcales bacterium]
MAGQQAVIDSYTLLTYSNTMQTVIETEFYLRDAKATGMSDTERAEIVNFLAANPDAGDAIKGGVSKNGLHGPNLLPRIWASSADTSLPPIQYFGTLTGFSA